MASRTVFITGATGLIGSMLADVYTNNSIDVIALSHSSKEDQEEHISWLQGDIREPNLGLSEDDLDTLKQNVTEIWHCAALTTFTISKEDATDVNVIGTKHVLELAKQCSAVEKIGVLSTLYVSGKRTGDIEEDFFIHSEGFVNEYERSKYEMEQLIENSYQSLPIAVYRIGTVIGDDQTGEVKVINAVHQSLRMLYGGLIPLVPSAPGSKINVVSENYVAACLYYLFEEKFRKGDVFHVAGEHEDMMEISEFIDETMAIMREAKPEWKKRNVEKPPITDLESFEQLREAVSMTKNSVLINIMTMMSSFVPQLSYPKNFKTDKTLAALSDSGIESVKLHEYYPKIVKHLVSRW